MPRAFALIVAAIFGGGCSGLPTLEAKYEWKEWQKLREESVAGTNGWTTVIGLNWLRDGSNTVGTDPANDIIIDSDHAPRFMGTFTRQAGNVSFSGVDTETVKIVPDTAPNPTRLQFGTVSMVVIQRGERFGLRVRDSDARARREFTGLRCFPYDPKWRIAGRYVPADSAKKLRVPDVTGGLQEFENPGEIAFGVGGQEYRLAVALEPDVPDFFVLFHDETAGDQTYAAGRFLYVQKPAVGDQVIIDFNRAYTPPCGFTPFATCPIPPRQNWLPLAIRAGELKPAPHK